MNLEKLGTGTTTVSSLGIQIQKTPASSGAQRALGRLKFTVTTQRNDSSVSNIQISFGYSHSKERAYEPHGPCLVSSAIWFPKIPSYLIKGNKIKSSPKKSYPISWLNHQ